MHAGSSRILQTPNSRVRRPPPAPDPKVRQGGLNVCMEPPTTPLSLVLNRSSPSQGIRQFSSRSKYDTYDQGLHTISSL